MTALSTFDSVDLDRDDSFRSMLSPLLDFHSLEELASVAPNWCKTSLAPVYGLQSIFPGSSLASLPLTAVSPGTHSLGSGQVPGRRPRMYHRTSSSSFRGPYTVPSGLALIALVTLSESWICSISLSHSQVSSLETILSSVCEVTSWLDWWLPTCEGFREHLTDEECGILERLMLSGSRALEFLGGQGIPALGILVLFRRDSLLLVVQSTVPAEEVARLQYTDLPSSSGLFPSPLLDSALNKMRAALTGALVLRTLLPPKIPWKS